MAEIVHKALEEMLPELTDLKLRKLFTEKELKSIVKRRTNFEYAIIRPNPLLVDFMRAIKYELDLDKLRRRRKLRLKQTRLGSSVSDFSIPKRVHALYTRALSRFPSDLSLWVQYIEWAISTGSTRILGRLFVRALHTHPLVPWLWVRAATYEFDVNGNVDAARIIFQRGLRINPSSPLLWQEFFKMEMRFIGRNITRKAALGLIPTCDVLQVTRMRESGTDLKEIHASEMTKKLSKSKVEELSNLLDEGFKKVLSGVLPITIYKNAIKNLKLKDSLEFRLGFLSHVDSWLSSEESQFTKNLFKGRKLKSSSISITRHANKADFISTRSLENIVDLECLEAAGVELHGVTDVILASVASDFGQSYESFIIRARAMLNNEQYIDPVIIYMVRKLERALVKQKGKGSTYSQTMMPLTRTFAKISTGLADEAGDDELINLLMKSSEVRSFALLEYMIRIFPEGTRRKAFFVFGTYMYERATYFSQVAVMARKEILSQEHSLEELKGKIFKSDAAEESAKRKVQTPLDQAKRRFESASKLAQCFVASFYRLANLSLNRIPSDDALRGDNFSLALGRLWLKLIISQKVDLVQELLVKCEEHPLGTLLKKIADLSMAKSKSKSKQREVEIEIDIEDEILSEGDFTSESEDSSDSESDSDSDSDSDSGSDGDSGSETESEDENDKTNEKSKNRQSPVVLSLLEVLHCGIKRSVYLRHRIDDGDLAAASLEKDFIPDEGDGISEDDKLELNSLTPFWLDVVDLFQNAYHNALLSEVMNLLDSKKQNGQISLAPLAWNRLHQAHEAALQAVPIQDAGSIFESLLSLNDFTSAFGSPNEKVEDFSARLLSTERIYRRAINYFREASASADSMTVTKSIVLNDVSIPAEVQRARLAAGVDQARTSRTFLSDIKSKYLGWALSVAASCTTALSGANGFSRVEDAARLIKRVVEECVLKDEASNKPFLSTITACFQAELEAFRLSMLILVKRKAEIIRLKAASSHRLTELHQEELDLAQSTKQRIRSLLEKGVVYYGSSQPTLWLEFIRCFIPKTNRNSTFEISNEETGEFAEVNVDMRSEFSSTCLADLDEISRTYTRAVRSLAPRCRQEFVTKYEALMHRHQ